MRRMLQVISWMALGGTLLPALLYLSDAMTLSGVKTWTLVATVAWFVATPMWMDRK